jgi:hypothetical protein
MANDPQAEPEAVFDIEAKGPLPNGLQLLALEFEMRRDRQPWCSTDANDELDSYSVCLSGLGSAYTLQPKHQSLFGTQGYVRVRFDILAAPHVVAKWLRMDNGKYDLEKCMKINPVAMATSPADEENEKSRTAPVFAKLTHAKLFTSFAHRFEDGRENDFYGEFYFKDVTPPYESDVTVQPGDFGRWALAAQATDKDFEQLESLSEACNGHAIQIADAIRRTKNLGFHSPTSFLVPGLIPRGVVTLLLGNKKVGKSTLALELAVADAKRETQWAGFPLNPGRGYAVCLVGEDSIDETFARIKLMTGGETPLLLWPMHDCDLAQAIAALREVNVSSLSVDPARKYLLGNEDSSEIVSNFFSALEAFAREKNASVIVSHHLTKNAEPRNVSDVANHYRGSGVFLDRPRVTLALHRASNETHLAIPILNNAPLHNFSQGAMFAGVRRLVRDEATFRHRCLDSASDQPKQARTADVDQVFAAASRIIVSGERLTRTGKTGLHEHKPPELAGMARTSARAAVDSLVGHGRLSVDDGGALTLPPPATRSQNLSDLIS